MIDVYAEVAREFDLGTPISTRPLGGRSVVELTTERGSFVVKADDTEAALRLYSTVERTLNARDIRQARLFRTSAGNLRSSRGFSVQELLHGSTSVRPSHLQAVNAFRYLSRYDAALSTINAPAECVDADGVWSRLASPAYLVENLPELLQRRPPAGFDVDHVRAGLKIIAGARAAFAQLPRQLVHGDVGPDNVLWDGDDVVAILDFTPFHASILFGACTAIYWFYVFPGDLDVAAVRGAFAAYAEQRPWSTTERELARPMILCEALRRIATPLAVAEQTGGSVDASAMQRRCRALDVALFSIPADVVP